jgi:hypothetical protein
MWEEAPKELHVVNLSKVLTPYEHAWLRQPGPRLQHELLSLAMKETKPQYTKGVVLIMARDLIGPNATAWVDEHITPNGRSFRLCKVGVQNPGESRKVIGAASTWFDAWLDTRANYHPPVVPQVQLHRKPTSYEKALARAVRFS